MNDAFEKDIRKTLDAGAGRIDQRTRDELARRRRAALDAAGPGSFRTRWLPAGAAAAALVVGVMLVTGTPDRTGLPVAADDSEEQDMEILLAEESLELYEELEFYAWLDTVGDAG